MNVPTIIQLYFRSSNSIEKKNKTKQKTKAGRSAPLWEKQKETKCVRHYTPGIGVWCNNTLTEEKRRWKKKNH